MNKITCKTISDTNSNGSVAEWSKALVLGTSHFDGVGSNPTAAKKNFFSFNITTKQCEFLFFKKSTGAKSLSRIPHRKLVLSFVPQKL